VGTEPQEQHSSKPQERLSSMNLIQPLIGWGKQFRGFLGIVAFILVIFLALITYLFSKGAFDQVLNGFGKLTSGQFLTVVYLVLGLPFIIIVLLIILSYRSTSSQAGSEEKAIHFYVSDSKTKLRLVDVTIQVSLLGTQTHLTDP
jgi:hypothetical protein